MKTLFVRPFALAVLGALAEALNLTAQNTPAALLSEAAQDAQT